MRLRCGWIGLFLLTLGAPAAFAQFSQYIAPGSLGAERVPAAEEIREQVAEARWRLGPLKIDPRLWLRDMAYLDNVFAAVGDEDKISDFRATAGAGAVAYLNLGPKVIASGFFLPEYVWWQEQDELSELNGIYGATLFGLFNRLTTQLEARRSEEERPLNNELEAPAELRQDRLALSFEVDLRGPVSLFGSIADSRLRYAGELERRLPDVELGALDRDELITNGGVRYTLANGVEVGLGYEVSDVDFVRNSGARSNRGSGPLISLDYSGDRVQVDVVGVYRTVDFDRPLGQGAFESLTGSGRVGLATRRELRLTLYGARNLVYSAFEVEGSIASERAGLSLGRPFGQRLQALIFAETGQDDYSVANSPTDRRDDYTAYGLTWAFTVSERAVLRIGASSNEYDSSDPASDRKATSIRIGLDLGGDFLPW